MARCIGKTKKGERCKNKAMEGTKFCVLHGSKTTTATKKKSTPVKKKPVAKKSTVAKAKVYILTVIRGCRSANPSLETKVSHSLDIIIKQALDLFEREGNEITDEELIDGLQLAYSDDINDESFMIKVNDNLSLAITKA